MQTSILFATIPLLHIENEIVCPLSVHLLHCRGGSTEGSTKLIRAPLFLDSGHEPRAFCVSAEQLPPTELHTKLHATLENFNAHLKLNLDL